MSGDNARTLYVGNLHADTTEESLAAFLSEYGEVEEVILSRHGKTEEFQHFAYVRFATRDHAVKAKEAAHGRLFLARPLWCDWSRPSDERWEAWLDPDAAPEYEPPPSD